MRRNVNMRAKEQSASKTGTIPDVQEVNFSEDSYMTTDNGRSGHVSGGVRALSAREAGRPRNPRGPESSTGTAGQGETRTPSSHAGEFRGGSGDSIRN